MSDIQNIKIRITTESDFSALDQDIKKLTAEEKALKEQINGVDAAAKSAGKALSEETTKANTAVKATNKSFGDLKGSVKDLAQNIPGAFQVQQVLNFAKGVNLSSVATGGLSGAMNILKIAFAATGIGALILALGSLVAYFTKTEKGSEMLERGLAQIGAVVGVVIGKFAALGEGIVQLFSGEFQAAADTFSNAFKDIGKEMLNAATAAGEFTNELQEIEDAEDNLAVKIAKTRNEIEKLIIQSKNRTATDAERIELLKQAEALETGIINEQIALQQRKVDALQKENDLKLKNGEIDKGNKTKELRDAEIQLENLKGNSLELLERIHNREDLLTEQQLADLAKKKKAYQDYSDFIKKNTFDLKEFQVKTNDDEVKKYEETQKRKIEISKETQNQWKKQQDYYADQTKAALEAEYKRIEESEANKVALKQQAVAGIIQIGNGLFDLQRENSAIELSELQAKHQAELKGAGDNKQAQAAINAKYAKLEGEAKRKQAQADKDQAIFNIFIQTAVNTVKALGTPPVPNIALAALVGGLGAAQLAFATAKPIPKFKDGSKGLLGGNGGVDDILLYANKGEGIMPTDRMRDYQPAFNAIFDRKVPADFLNSIVMNYDRIDQGTSRGGSDMSGLKSEIRSLGNKLDKLQILQVNMDKKGFNTYLKSENSKTQIENNYLRVG